MWLPIESAPRDDSWNAPGIIGYVPEHGVMEIAWNSSWYGDKSKPWWGCANLDEEYGCPIEPPHWQPLPEPPQ